MPPFKVLTVPITAPPADLEQALNQAATDGQEVFSMHFGAETITIVLRERQAASEMVAAAFEAQTKSEVDEQLRLLEEEAAALNLGTKPWELRGAKEKMARGEPLEKFRAVPGMRTSQSGQKPEDK